MAWRIELTATAVKRLAKLDPREARRITAYLRERLAALGDPRSERKALAGPRLGGYWRYRIGDDRLICEIRDDKLIILVIEIGNRKDIHR